METKTKTSPLFGASIRDRLALLKLAIEKEAFSEESLRLAMRGVWNSGDVMHHAVYLMRSNSDLVDETQALPLWPSPWDATILELQMLQDAEMDIAPGSRELRKRMPRSVDLKSIQISRMRFILLLQSFAIDGVKEIDFEDAPHPLYLQDIGSRLAETNMRQVNDRGHLGNLETLSVLDSRLALLQARGAILPCDTDGASFSMEGPKEQETTCLVADPLGAETVMELLTDYTLPRERPENYKDVGALQPLKHWQGAMLDSGSSNDGNMVLDVIREVVNYGL
tara:strand:- start:787 stop:1629 length:843 start_codon:yes stop_codon:yes gene_type:complete